MQKVEGSSPFIRFEEPAGNGGFAHAGGGAAAASGGHGQPRVSFSTGEDNPGESGESTLAQARVTCRGFARSLSRRTLSADSADVDRQALIWRDEFFPACLDVVGFAASEVRGEVFGVDLPAGSEESDCV